MLASPSCATPVISRSVAPMLIFTLSPAHAASSVHCLDTASQGAGKSDTVEGRKCRVWHFRQDGNVIDEMCVVPFSTLPGKEDMRKTMMKLAEAFAGMRKNVPGAAEQVKARNGIDGYPVRSRPYFNGKPQGVESVLKSWTETNIPAANFEIPAGYTKKAPPSMGE